MRNDNEMMKIIMDFAKEEENIRIVTMEGSKLNKNAPVDKFQDYDISYFVMDMEKYKNNDNWLDIFGKRIIMQKPENMPLFPPDWLGKSNRFSYLMTFEDGNKIDLSLVPINELNLYFEEADSLTKILLDKDNICPKINEPSDFDFIIKKPSEIFIDNCCNEFWNLSLYVVKGLCRNEIFYAIKHLDLLKEQLFTMISWKVGIDKSFSVSVGKSYKYLYRFISEELFNILVQTYKNNSINNIWDSLIECCNIFNNITAYVVEKLNYKMPEYNKKVGEFIKQYMPKEKWEKIK